MLCVVDVGNTHTVFGLFREKEIVERWRMRTDAKITTDEWGLTFKNMLDIKNIRFDEIAAMAIACVVPPAIHSLVRATERYLGVEPLVVGPGVKTGVPILIENPREVGADRIVNAVAAFARFQNAAIIVDFGTATTFDCISSKGEYLGGAIAPGIGTSLDALVTRAAKLPRVEIRRPRSPLGKNTIEGMQSGILFGYISLVDGLVERLIKEMGGPVAVIATGGLAGVIASESSTIQSVDPNLTLEGLRLIYLRNQN